MRAPSIWKTLGIKATSDKSDIRRAYAKQLKITHPEDDPEGFKVLRAAYEQALQRAAWNSVPVDAVFITQADEAEDDEGEDAPEIEPESATGIVAQIAAEIVTAPETAEPPAAPARLAPTPAPAPEIDRDAAAYSASCQALEKLLRPRATASDDDRLAALNAVLASPMLDSIATRDGAEYWLAQLIVRTQPRSDALVFRAIAYFGWSKHTIGRRQVHGVYDIFVRADDLRFLQIIRSPNSDSLEAFHALSAPPPTTLRGRLFQKASREDVEALLGRIRRSHPGVEADLNAESIKAWEDRLKHVDISGVNLWMLIATPFCLLITIVLAFSYGWGALAAYIFLWIPPVWAVAAVGVQYAYKTCDRLWQGNPRWQRNPWLAFGWGPALIALLLLATAPPAPWLTAVTVFLSLAIVWWAAITGEPDRSESSWPWQLRLVVSEIFLLGWWLFSAWDVPAASALQMTPVVLAAMLVSGLGRLPLLRAWLRLRPMMQRIVLGVIIAAAIGAVAFLWSAYDDEGLRALAFAGGATVMLLARVPALSTPNWSGGFVRVACYLTLVITRAQGGPMMTLAVVGTVLLGLTAINAGVAFARVKGR